MHELDAACLLVAATNSQASLLLAMAILGVGWNLCLLSGSALLIRGVAAAARPRREGWGGDQSGMAGSVGGGSGAVMAADGYSALATYGAAIAALALPAAFSTRHHRPRNA